MSEIEEALQAAARTGYKAAENGKNLEDVLKNVKVQPKEAQEA